MERQAGNIATKQRIGESKRGGRGPGLRAVMKRCEPSFNRHEGDVETESPAPKHIMPRLRPRPALVEDYDKQMEKDPSAMATYAEDIFNYYKYRERYFKVGNYLERHQFTEETRAGVIDWMVGLQERLELNHETLYLAVKLFDLYLWRAGKRISARSLILIASGATFLASKYDVSGDNFDADELVAMEKEVFRGVGFDLGAPLSYRFLRRYSRVNKQKMSTLTLARYALETSLMFSEVSLLPDSLVAAAAFLFAVRVEGNTDWSPTMDYYSGYRLSEVEALMWRLNALIDERKAKYPKLTNVYDKYSHEVFYGVALRATLTPPQGDNANEEMEG